MREATDAALEFNPTRLLLGRQARGLTKTELADLVGLDRRTLHGYESGTMMPSQAAVRKLSVGLAFPEAFFAGGDWEELDSAAVSFRAMSRMTASQRAMAHSVGRFALALNRWIDKHLELPAVQVPDFSQETDPEAAAVSLRHAWGHGEQPVKHVIHLLE
ncbi:MAG: helix-turn-helix transcriptional regulator, partial [Thermomicrobiales bacterium]|nr:helix-turn-helix transcriptional regulator [Thermomicrobiales bacterium]